LIRARSRSTRRGARDQVVIAELSELRGRKDNATIQARPGVAIAAANALRKFFA
jgi:hypothetical protein